MAEIIKNVVYDYITGHATDEIYEHLTRSIAQYEKHYSSVKIGITGRFPEVRFKEHLDVDLTWKKMIVKYKTKSERYCNEIEQHFIATRPNLANEWIGKSHLAEGGDNYVYFLVK